jgi:tRNA pseudouridine13 synthase
MSIDPQNPPLLTPELPGVGGRIKVQPEDFEVEEIPAYEHSGAGEHLYLWVEKRGMGADYFHRQVARRLNVPNGEVGTAGLKDRHAVTRQWVSVPASCEALLPQLDGDGIRVLNATRHNNKLRPGHLRGNKFRILVRDADATKGEELSRILQRVRDEGMPNYYGPQRFGHDGETAAMGMALLKGESRRGRNPFLHKLALSAAQSVLFNYTLGQRLLDGLLRKVLPGDAMMKWPFGGIFTVENVEAEQERFDRREIITGGPIFGKKMFPAHGEALERESKVLQAFGLTREHFGEHGKLLSGTRRYNLIYPDDLESEWTPDGLRLGFSLPAGCYATVLLREAMKLQVVGEETDE